MENQAVFVMFKTSALKKTNKNICETKEFLYTRKYQA